MPSEQFVDCVRVNGLVEWWEINRINAFSVRNSIYDDR